MATLELRRGIYFIRFRFRRDKHHPSQEYKRSLRTRTRREAEAAKIAVELVIHRLLTGQQSLPPGVEPGDFIASGGTLGPPAEPPAPLVFPTTRMLMERYLETKRGALADSYHYSQRIHLKHFTKHLGDLVDRPCNEVTDEHVKRFFEHRLKIRHSETVTKERITLLSFYAWIATNKEASPFASPVTQLPPSKSSGDRPPFRTISEIQEIVDRGGLSEEEAMDLWECLYLSPREIAGLLATVRQRAARPVSFLLHCLPAYSGARRGEILRLRWQDVDFQNNVIVVQSRKQSRTKTISRRQIDLHPELRQYLLEWREAHPKGQFVICHDATLAPLTVDEANRLFWRPMRGTKWCLDGRKNWFKVTFHCYRHSFCSNLAAAGVDQRVIDGFVGHSTEEMRMRYRHLFPHVRRSAIESFSLSTNVEDPQP